MSEAIFQADDFLAEFPEFSDSTVFPTQTVAIAGRSAMRFITAPEDGFPLVGSDRGYALFLLTAHILTLSKNATDAIASGSTPSGGLVVKSIVGSVSVEMQKPNTYTQTEWEYWLNQTTYGQQLQAYLSVAAPCGLFGIGLGVRAFR